MNNLKRDKNGKTSEVIKAYLLLFCLSGVFFGQLFKRLREFYIINNTISVYATVICTLLCTVLIGTFIVTRKSVKSKMQIFVWLSTNVSKIDLCYAVPMLFLVSIKPNIEFDINELKDIISLAWTIFSIIIAIYAVWQVLIPKFLKGMQPQYNAYSNDQQVTIIHAKSSFYEKVSVYYASPTLIAVTLLTLLFATCLVYLETRGVTLWNQNIALFSFYCCTNTIFLIFMDVLKPINSERNALLQNSTVSKEEIEAQADMEEKRRKAEDFIEVISQMDNISEDEKNNLKKSVQDFYRLDDKETV